MNDSGVPAGPGDLDAARLSEALGVAVGVAGVHRVGAEHGFGGRCYRIEVEGDAVPRRLIVKLWEMRDANDARELEFYRRLAPRTPVRLPRFHHGEADVEAGRAWIIIEALENFRQGDDLVPEDLDSVLGVVDHLARIHRQWWDRLDGEDWLVEAPRFRRDAEYLASRRTEYVDRFGEIPDPLTRRLFDAIPSAVEVAAILLEGAPTTLLHMDLGLDNILFLLPDEEPVIVDWANCGRGPGVHDLAAILFNQAPLDGFGDVVDRYTAGIGGDGDAIRRWLSGAMLHMFITRTLGVARWSATTPRGLEILDAWVADLPTRVARWHAADPETFDRVLG